MGVPGAELHVVADHQQGHPLPQQSPQNQGEGLLELRVQALGGLVQQQDLRLQQQHLGQGRPLLLAAGQVVGVPVQQVLQAAQGRHPGHPLLLPGAGCFRAGEYLKQVLPDRFLHKQGLGILGQHPHASPKGNFAPLGLFHAGQQPQGGAFSRAVAAQQGQELPPAQGQVQPLYNVRAVRLIPEPHPPGRYHRLPPGVRLLPGQGAQRTLRGISAQKVPPLPDGDGAGGLRLHRGPDAHGGGHGQEHPVAQGFQLTAHLLGGAGAQEPAPVHHRHGSGQGKGFFQPVLRQHHGGAQLPVDLPQHRQEVRGGDGVQLAGGLVQDQHVRLHGHDRGQVQQLLLSAGQLRHVPVKPVLDAEEGRHLRHPAADGGGVRPQALQPEGQLVPHLVGDDLVFRRLLDKADAGRLGPLVHLLQGGVPEQDAPLPDPVGGQGGLQLPQQGGLAAARRAAQHQKGPLRHRQGQAVNGRGGLPRIGKAQVFDGEQRHARASLRSRITGVRHRARYAR